MLEEELGLREGRRFRNALKLSRLPHHKTLDQFDFAFQPGLDARKVRDLATLEFVHSRTPAIGRVQPVMAECRPSGEAGDILVTAGAEQTLIERALGSGWRKA
jgi:hypothetical protein